MAMGGASKRGVVAVASYEARKFGVFSAQPSPIALRNCPDLIFVKPRFDVYKEVSNQIRQIFLKYTDLVESLSLDEAYLDVTEIFSDFSPKSVLFLSLIFKVKIVFMSVIGQHPEQEHNYRL